MRRLLLVLLALTLTAPTFAAEKLEGVYACLGTYPNGKTYTGLVEIAPSSGGTYLLHWVIDEAEYVGVGFVSKGTLVVAAGPLTELGAMLANVAVYKIDGSKPMVGQWAMPGGKQLYPETLTRTKDHPKVEAPATPAPHPMLSAPMEHERGA